MQCKVISCKVSGAIEFCSYILSNIIIIISLVNEPVQMCNKCSETGVENDANHKLNYDSPLNPAF